MKVEIDEYAKDDFRDLETVKKLETFIEGELKKDLEKTVQIIQEEKIDALGLARFIRSGHYAMYEEDWHSKYAQLDLDAGVKVELAKVGILH